MNIWIHVALYVHMYVGPTVCIVCMYDLYVCTYVCTYVCMYVCMYVYMKSVFVTVRAGTAYRHPFSREENLFVMYYKRISYLRTGVTGQSTRCLRKNCAKLFMSELCQIPINCNNFW